MTVYQLVGIDPGVVHSGVVSLVLNDQSRKIVVDWDVISGDTPDEHAEGIHHAVQNMFDIRARAHRQVTMEAYRDRGSIFSTNVEMRALENKLSKLIPQAVKLDNMGVKKVVKPKLLKALGLTGFPTTHHQDLQSAARILVLRGLKHADINTVLTRVVTYQLDGQPWSISNGAKP